MLIPSRVELLDNNTQAFLALVRAGLWEKDVRLSQFNNIELSESEIKNTLSVSEIAEEDRIHHPSTPTRNQGLRKNA